jgi:hypothetical protein
VRRRAVTIDLQQLRRRLRTPAPGDVQDWKQARQLLAGEVQPHVFAIWIDPLELIGVDHDGALLLACPERLSDWISRRFWPVIARSAAHAGREIRLAEEAQRLALRGLRPGQPTPGAPPRSTPTERGVDRQPRRAG